MTNMIAGSIVTGFSVAIGINIATGWNIHWSSFIPAVILIIVGVRIGNEISDGKIF